jgi:hypothetical protein
LQGLSGEIEEQTTAILVASAFRSGAKEGESLIADCGKKARD